MPSDKKKFCSLSCASKGKLSKEAKESISKKSRENILKRYSEGWQPKAGRCKKIEYTSPIAGVVFLDGSWEYLVAKWLDCNKLIWCRNKERFSYINLQGKQSYYTPDFYIKDWESYLEVKGYETNLDKCKWSQFPHKLIIWRKDDVDKIRE